MAKSLSTPLRAGVSVDADDGAVLVDAEGRVPVDAGLMAGVLVDAVEGEALEDAADEGPVDADDGGGTCRRR